jgi:hypothetical protein
MQGRTHLTRHPFDGLVTILVLLSLCPACFNNFSRAPHPPLDTAFYVWQRAWSPEIREAIDRAKSASNAFLVLCGEFHANDNAIAFESVEPDWAALAEARVDATLVFRARSELARALSSNTRDVTSARLVQTLQASMEAASRAGVHVAGLQMDYDCPTAQLEPYAAFIKTLRQAVPQTPLSITALPTWLPDPAFRALAATVDHYVLQVHSFERPKLMDKPLTICEAKQAATWIEQAERVGKPYRLALPTYGYRVAFDPDGHFAGIDAENEQNIWPASYQVKEAMANPREIAAIVARVQQNPPNHLRGIVWFRLPISTDKRNWTWDTLRAVMAGQAPAETCTAELRDPQPGLLEVWVKNTGDISTTSQVRVTLQGKTGDCIANDCVNGFDRLDEKPESTILRGPVPRSDRAVMAAWFRFPLDKPSISNRMAIQHVETFHE